MKKNTGNTKGKTSAQRHRRPCLMAYTLNNTQPVICTLIADQPYFYMDDESIPEDDDFLGMEDFTKFENELAELKSKMDSYERLSKTYQRDPKRRMEEFTAAGLSITEARTTTENIMQPADKIVSILAQSRMAKSLLDFAQTHSIHIVESEQVDTARYDRESGKILIHPSLGEAEQCLLAVRELRRHWLHRKGALIHPLTFHPDQAILINRAQIADMTIAMIRTAWELQLAGSRDVWDHLENSSMADLAHAFAREAFVDFRSIASGKAASAVFESWFLSERTRHQDKKLIQAMLADHQGYVFTNEEASRSISIELIVALGEQPFGKNYLAPYASMIIEDPVFTEVRDRSNANFLWFIKFERSFRETEQALQSEEGITGSGILSASPQDKASEPHEPSIVPIRPGAASIHRTNGRLQTPAEAGFDGDNVIHVRFGATAAP